MTDGAAYPAPRTAGSDGLAIVADPSIGSAPHLAAAALAAAAGRPDLAAVALVDAGTAEPSRVAGLLRAGARAVRRLARQRRRPKGAHLGPTPDLRRLARRHGVPLLVPAERGLNHPDLIANLRDRLGVRLVLSVGCRQLFRPPFLAAFDLVANVHDGLLPAYRGLAATSWSLYDGAAESGFSVHRVDAGVDTGAVLLSEALPVAPGTTLLDLLRAKTARAAARMDEVLDAMVRRDSGRPQEPGGGYRGAEERRALTVIADPAALAAEELQRRLAAFGLLHVHLAGRSWEVTALRPARRPGRRSSSLAFTTSDGVALEPYRFRRLPKSLYRLAARLAPTPGAP